MHVDEHTIEVASSPVFYRHAPADGTPVLYLHSVPTSSDDFTPFLERTGGFAPDLPGFGRSGKGGHLEYSLPAYTEFALGFLEAVGIDRVTLVGHGWGGAIALSLAQRQPGPVAAITLIDAVPLLGGFSWPRPVTHVRRPLLGELLMGSVNRRLLARTLRTAGSFNDTQIDQIWDQFDQGTQRAILRLHRSIDADGLAAAGGRLRDLTIPTMIVWGERDPWLGPELGEAYAAALPNAELTRIPQAGHWPWHEDPSVIDRVAAFATASR